VAEGDEVGGAGEGDAGEGDAGEGDAGEGDAGLGGGGGGAVTVVGASGAGGASEFDGVGRGGGGVVLGGGDGVVFGAGGRQIGNTEDCPSSLSCLIASSRVPPGSPAVTWARSDSRRSATFKGLQPERLSSTPMLVIELRESRQAI
jgi:hypothetical protein